MFPGAYCHIKLTMVTALQREDLPLRTIGYHCDTMLSMSQHT